MKSKACIAALALVAVSACSQMRPEIAQPDAGHLEASGTPRPSIPAVVEQAPFVPPPEPVPESERYTVVVNDVPVRELLFALARDAQINVDISNEVSGRVTLNAIDQTLNQILDRIGRQVAIRHELRGGTVVITPDLPYLRTYDVGYVNLSRDVDTTVNVATRVATTGGGAADDVGGGGGRGGGGGAGDNTSSTRLESRSFNRFWETLNDNILAILGESGQRGQNLSDKVILNAEAGIVTVRATKAQHELIESFIDKVLVNARRQVLIEATIVEITLNDQYQAGVDWTLFLEEGAGFAIDQNLLGAGINDGVIDNAISSFSLTFVDPTVGNNAIAASVRLLREFGDAQVLSSPRLMVLNNQTAILKVVEELVYFTIQVLDKDGTNNQQGRTFVESEVRSVPVGLVMAVTPQISPNAEVTLTVRPTISQKVGDAIDPGTQLAAQSLGAAGEGIVNTVPIIQVREMESVLKLIDGQVGVLGGLMRDEIQTGSREVPGLADLPILGDIFFDTDEYLTRKNELVIFLRPVVVDDPDINTDLEDYRQFLGGRNIGASAAAIP
ncbi:MAG: type II secretion system protein GspD [Gammaproteobacteria bacterium]